MHKFVRYLRVGEAALVAAARAVASESTPIEALQAKLQLSRAGYYRMLADPRLAGLSIKIERAFAGLPT